MCGEVCNKTFLSLVFLYFFFSLHFLLFPFPPNVVFRLDTLLVIAEREGRQFINVL